MDNGQYTKNKYLIDKYFPPDNKDDEIIKAIPDIEKKLGNF